MLLPGALATWAFYEDILAEPSIRESGISFIATTVPGFGGTTAPDDLSMESYSSSASRLAADLLCEQLHPRCHLVWRAVQAPRQPDDNRGHTIVFRREAQHLVRGLLERGSIERGGAQDADGARKRAGCIADRDANASRAHV